MTTVDFPINTDGSWLAIPPLATSVILHNASNITILVRLGASSTSYGMRLAPDGTMAFDETVYVKPLITNGEIFGSMRVSR